MSENIKHLQSNSDFNILVISFDPRDNLQDMTNLSKQYGLENNLQWNFAITDSIDAFINSIGFIPKWDSVIKQFDHDALLVGVNEKGLITKNLLGIRIVEDVHKMISSIKNNIMECCCITFSLNN